MFVTAHGLTKSFGSFTAVDDVTFHVQQGEIVGLVGPNGAGKTTIVHMLLGLITASGGTIRLFGKELERDRESILSRLNFTSPYMGFPRRLTVTENLDVYARLYAVADRTQRITELLATFGIAHLAKSPIAQLSSGETTRVGLCKAFLNRPELLLLDEPTAFLDPEAALGVRRLLADMQRRDGTTVLYTSHNMREVQHLCDRVLFLKRGRIVAKGTPLEVTRDLLGASRDVPALEEAFIRIAGEAG